MYRPVHVSVRPINVFMAGPAVLQVSPHTALPFEISRTDIKVTRVPQRVLELHNASDINNFLEQQNTAVPHCAHNKMAVSFDCL